MSKNTPDQGAFEGHKKLEKNVTLLAAATFVTVAIGGIIEIAPLFWIDNTIEKVEGMRPYSPLELSGRDIYIREGCYTCHSQMIRPFRDEVERYGHYSLAAESMYDHPFQWGSKRTGPDLARVGGRYSDEWHVQHLKDPQSVVPRSIMPSYSFLAETPLEIADVSANLTALSRVGVPYTDIDIEMAEADLFAQADPDIDEGDLATRYPKAQIRDFDGNPSVVTEMDAMIARSVDWLRDAGVTSLNFDLMCGLPGQTRGDLADSLEYASRMGADRIALFGYAHVPHFVPRQRVIDATTLPERDTRFAMASQGYEFLTKSGYKPIGFDHFALPHDPMAEAARTGTLRRNFQGFTEDRSDTLIGLGASAVSGFPGLIAQNEKNIGRYRMLAGQGHLTAAHGIARPRDDQHRALLIEDLLCRSRASLSPCLMARIAERLEPFVERGLAIRSGLDLIITEQGLPYARVIASFLDRFREETTKTFSAAI